MENQAFKSTVFGGFDKKSVLSYIFELNENAQDAQQKLNDQIVEFTSSRDELSRKLEEAEAGLTAARSGLDEANARIDEEAKKNAELTSQIDRLKFENTKQKQIIENRDEEIARISEMNAGLEEKTLTLEEKRGQVELAASQIAGLFKQARNDADKLMEQAREDAEGVLSAARSEAAQITKDAHGQAEAIIQNANSSIDGVYRQYDDFCKELGAVQQHMIDALSMMNAKIKTVNRAAAKARDTATESLWSLNGNGGAAPEEPENEQEPQKADAEKSTETTMTLANEILNQYGIRKDESGFFRLASEE